MARSVVPKIRLTVDEKPTYSIDNPNPDWKTKGEAWIKFALNDDVGGYDVAYVPSTTITIVQDGKTCSVLPTYWEPKEKSDNPEYVRENFDLSDDKTFRLNARRKPSANLPFVGSRINIDLDPRKDEDKEIIFNLLKLAEIIYEPGKHIFCDKGCRPGYEKRVRQQRQEEETENK